MQTIKQIRDAFDKLHWAFDAQMINWADRLFDKCKAEEKEHRGFLPSFTQCHTPDTISISDAARLFAVKRVAEYLTGTKYPTGQDYLHTQKSCFLAAGMADEFGAQILVAWKDLDLTELASLNYTDYVKVEKAGVA